MSLKLKILGLGLIAALAMGAVSVTGATATTGGHFTSTAEHTIISGTDIAVNPIEFTVNGEGISCASATYDDTHLGKKFFLLLMLLTYFECEHNLGDAHVNMNNCKYEFTISTTPNSDNTTHLTCPGASGPTTTITGPFGTCTITITPDQTPSGGVAFTAGSSGGKADITANVTMSGIHVILDGGFFACGTSTATHQASIHGEITISGKDAEGNPVDIAAT